MCTLALYFQQLEGFPLLVAANRDEHFDRPSAAPELWQSEPKIVAGKDLRAGGTWLGANRHGLVVGILNRRMNGEPPAQTASRSRGLLCLDLLRFSTAARADNFLSTHESHYNPFTVVFADPSGAYVSYNSESKIITQRLDAGLHVFSSAADFYLRSAKAERAHERFASLLGDSQPQRVEPRHWLPALQTVLADHSLGDGGNEPGDAICVHRDVSGTVSSSVIFYSQAEQCFETFYCAGAPCQNSFADSLALEVR